MLGIESNRKTIKGEFADNLREQIGEIKKKYPWQTCQDDELDKKFCVLHHTLVNQIVEFCLENDIKIDDVHLDIDGLRDSIMFGQWAAATDSSMTMYRFDDEHPHRQNRSEIEPFLCSM
jgi:hypothetical protein